MSSFPNPQKGQMMTKALKSTIILAAIATPASAFAVAVPTVTYDMTDADLQSAKPSAEKFAIASNIHLGDFQEISRDKTIGLSFADMYTGDGAALMSSVRSVV